VQEWKTVLEEECLENKWQSLAIQCNAKRNYAHMRDFKYPQVTLEMLENEGGIEYWNGMQVTLSGKEVTDDKQTLGSHGIPSAPMDSTGLSWASMSFLGLSLTPLNSTGLNWAYALGSPELSSALLRSPGLPWPPLGSPYLSWAILGSPGLSWALLSSLKLSLQAKEDKCLNNNKPPACAALCDAQNEEAVAAVEGRTASAGCGRPPQVLKPEGKTKAKAKATAKTAANKQTAEFERKAKNVLSSWKFQTNRVGRIQNILQQNVAEWKWAEADLQKYDEIEKALETFLADKSLKNFVMDFTAAIFSPQAMKQFKNGRKDTMAQDLTLLVDGIVPGVKDLEECVQQIEDTAKARKCTDFTPEKLRR
jgi:hypothetical protein